MRLFLVKFLCATGNDALDGSALNRSKVPVAR